MRRILDLTIKDLYQIVRDWKSALFLLIMPVVFTLLFGYVFSGVGEQEDPRLPVGVLNLDAGSAVSAQLIDLLDTSDVIRPVPDAAEDEAALAQLVSDEELVAAVIVPAGYGARMREGDPAALRVIVEDNASAGHSAHVAVQGVANRLLSAVQSARLAVDALAMADPDAYAAADARAAAFDAALVEAVAAWVEPPFTIEHTATGQPSSAADEVYGSSDFSHSSAGMMAQFAIAGLIGSAEVVVAERKSRTLQRLMTTAISRAGVIAGHFLAMFVMVLAQLTVLTLFGVVLGVPYAEAPLATVTIVTSFAFFAAALGMLIGALAKTEEQVIVLALLPMFVLSALGGAWMPLEFTPPGFQAVARLTPVTWAIIGLKHITVRGFGLDAVLLPALVLLGYGLLCLIAAVRFFRVT